MDTSSVVNANHKLELLVALKMGVKMARVLSRDGKPYYYKIPQGLYLAEGDHVVTEGMRVAKVDAILGDILDVADIDEPREYKWLIGMVDMSPYNRSVEVAHQLTCEITEQRKDAIRKALMDGVLGIK